MCSCRSVLGSLQRAQVPKLRDGLGATEQQMSLASQIPHRGRPGKDAACVGSLDRKLTVGRLQEALCGYLVENFR